MLSEKKAFHPEELVFPKRWEYHNQKTDLCLRNAVLRNSLFLTEIRGGVELEDIHSAQSILEDVYKSELNHVDSIQDNAPVIRPQIRSCTGNH